MINCVMCPCGGMVDATDLKSVVLSGVGVRVPPRAPSGHNCYTNFQTKTKQRLDAIFLSCTPIQKYAEKSQKPIQMQGANHYIRVF